MDLMPAIPAGRQLINGYGNGGFRISGQRYTGSVLVFPESTRPWPVARIETLESAHFDAVRAAADAVDILLLGCGAKAELLRADLREALRSHGVIIECMDTGAACRTYNVLMAEERRVAAALIAVE